MKFMNSLLQKSIKIIELEQLAKGSIWPVTIVMDRYTGVYSGAKWLAFQMYSDNIPDGIGSDDGGEMMFWREHNQLEMPIGKGETPDDALKDLMIKAKAYWENR